MRDLQADKEYLMTPFSYQIEHYDSQYWKITVDDFRRVQDQMGQRSIIALEAIERAIVAEAEVERLRDSLKQTVNECGENMHEVVEEIGQLRDALEICEKALRIACRALDAKGNCLTPGGWSLEHTFLKQAQREIERSVGWA